MSLATRKLKPATFARRSVILHSRFKELQQTYAEERCQDKLEMGPEKIIVLHSLPFFP